MSKLRFSIITPTFQCGAKVKKTIESVLSQDHSDFEYFVIDGGSTDATISEIEYFADDKRLRWWSEPDEGIYDAMNKGIRAASGDFLYFLGAGDLLRPGVLSRVQLESLRVPSIELLYGDVFWVDRNVKYDGHFNRYKLLRKNVCHQAMFFRHSLFSRLGLYDLQFPELADYAFNLRCFGDRTIQKRYMPLVIADYEGGGVTSCAVPDPHFAAMFSSVIRRELGPIFYRIHVHYHRIERLLNIWKNLRVSKNLKRRGKGYQNNRSSAV